MASIPQSTADRAAGLYPPAASAVAARRVVAVLAGTLLIAACAHISVPLYFTPVPLTLQPFAVMLIGLLFGPALGAATCAAYLAEGALGLPVFTPHGLGGVAQLFGPTGGYLLSYPFAAAVAGVLARVSSRRTFIVSLAAALASSLVILACGASWLALLTHRSAAAVAQIAVFPFLGEDLIKVVLAALLATAWFRFDRSDATARP